MNLSSKTVFITGGSSGIGLACAEQCARSGASIAIFAREKSRLRDAVESIERHRINAGQRFGGYSLDVSEPDDVVTVMKKAVKETGDPYILINSAGLGGAFHFEELPYRRFDQTMKINVYGIRNTVAALLPYMKRGGGHIANVSSIGGVIGVFGYTAYSASKFAVIGLSECLRSELRRYGINVSVLLPPDTDTPMMRNEDATKPEETKAINRSGGLVSPEFVASALFRGLKKKRFMIIPGFKGRMIVLLKRVFPAIPEAVMNRTVRKVQAGE